MNGIAVIIIGILMIIGIFWFAIILRKDSEKAEKAVAEEKAKRLEKAKRSPIQFSNLQSRYPVPIRSKTSRQNSQNRTKYGSTYFDRKYGSTYFDIDRKLKEANRSSLGGRFDGNLREKVNNNSGEETISASLPSRVVAPLVIAIIVLIGGFFYNTITMFDPHVSVDFGDALFNTGRCFIYRFNL